MTFWPFPPLYLTYYILPEEPSEEELRILSIILSCDCEIIISIYLQYQLRKKFILLLIKFTLFHCLGLHHFSKTTEINPRLLKFRAWSLNIDLSCQFWCFSSGVDALYFSTLFHWKASPHLKQTDTILQSGHRVNLEMTVTSDSPKQPQIVDYLALKNDLSIGSPQFI